MMYRKSSDLAQGQKRLAVIHRSEDEHCHTTVIKKFRYDISQTDFDQVAQTPEVYIKKNIDSEKNVERFQFNVKGSFVIKNQRALMNVVFQHELKICIRWKSQNKTSKKSEILT